MSRWEGRVALVTGASVGIGAAISRKLVENGMKVIGVARRVEKIEELSKQLSGSKGSLTAIKCDIAKDEEVYELFKKVKDMHGGVDVCVNNAGLSFNSSLIDGSTKDWRTMMDVNVIALCLCSKLTAESMIERGIDDGHIINISSLSGYRVAPISNLHFYSATKFAVKALTEGFRQEFRESKSHIRVTSVSPGLVETEFFGVMYQSPEEATKRYSLLKTLTASDVAEACWYALSAPPHVDVNDILLRPTEQAS